MFAIQTKCKLTYSVKGTVKLSNIRNMKVWNLKLSKVPNKNGRSLKLTRKYGVSLGLKESKEIFIPLWQLEWENTLNSGLLFESSKHYCKGRYYWFVSCFTPHSGVEMWPVLCTRVSFHTSPFSISIFNYNMFRCQMISIGFIYHS